MVTHWSTYEPDQQVSRDLIRFGVVTTKGDYKSVNFFVEKVNK